VNGSRILYRVLVWLAAVLGVILFPAVIVMMAQIVLAHWFTIAIFLAVVVGFPRAAHLENKR
jgi:hypothetical protein